MKGLILAAGQGTRLRPLTLKRSKPMLPVANQPLIAYPLQKLMYAGITDIGIVVGENEQELRAGLSHVPANLSFIRQAAPKGLADAVRCAREFCADEEFLLLFCDNLFFEPLGAALADWHRLRGHHREMEAMIHVISVEDPRAFGVAEVEDGWVTALVEKPEQPKSDLAVLGIDLLTPRIFEMIERIKPSARGELEITDAIAALTEAGHRVYARPLNGFWYDTGTFPDLIQVLRPLMDDFGIYGTQGRYPGSTLKGPVGIGRDSVVTDCELNGPVMIGAQCQVTGCVLGPYTAVGDRCVLDSCTLRHAQLYAGTQLSGVLDQEVIYDGELRVDAATPRGT